MIKSILTPKIDNNIGFQIRRIQEEHQRHINEEHPTITISREFGCEGYPLANELSRQLEELEGEKWVIFHRQMLHDISEQDEYSQELMNLINEASRSKIHQYIEYLFSEKPPNYWIYKRMVQNIKILAQKGRAIIVGSGASIIAQEEKDVLNVRLKASEYFRAKRVAKQLGIEISEARKLITKSNLDRETFVQEFTQKDVNDPSHYHLIFDNEYLNARQIASLVIEAMKLKKLV